MGGRDFTLTHAQLPSKLCACRPLKVPIGISLVLGRGTSYASPNLIESVRGVGAVSKRGS